MRRRDKKRWLESALYNLLRRRWGVGCPSGTLRCHLRLRSVAAGGSLRGNSDGMFMKCPRKFLVASVAIFLALTALAALRTQEAFGQGAGQDASPQTQDPRARIRTTVTLVVVPVTVKDSQGELVTDLQQNDFRVFEDGVEQPIALFSADAFPLSVAVLIDDDLKTGTAEKVQKTLETVAGAFSAFAGESPLRVDEGSAQNFRG